MTAQERGWTLTSTHCLFYSQIFGNDNRGRMRGMGVGVSKTAIKYSDPYKKALQMEQESRTILEAQVEKLEKRLGEESRELRLEMDHILASLSLGGT